MVLNETNDKTGQLYLLNNYAHDEFQDILLGGRIVVQQCFEFGAVNWQKKRGIFVRKTITITYILYINL